MRQGAGDRGKAARRRLRLAEEAAHSSSLRQTTWNNPTIAAARPAAAPTPSDQRGPKWSATHPTIGAPMGVAPRAIASRIAITRPRITGSEANCIKLLVEVQKGRPE